MVPQPESNPTDSFRHFFDTAKVLDKEDPLQNFRDRFIIEDASQIYLDGNSLGRPSSPVAGAQKRVIDVEWSVGLVNSWKDWIELPIQAGQGLAEHVLGASQGEVIVTDSTTVNLYKLAYALATNRSGYRYIVSDTANFPTDLYILKSVADQLRMELHLIQLDPVNGVQESDYDGIDTAQIAFASHSHVNYRSASITEMVSLQKLADAAKFPLIWDLSHSAGLVDLELNAHGARFAVGCTYKYLGAGPGSPAFMYIREDEISELKNPIPGWFGAADQFRMANEYRQKSGIERFMTGTPSPTGLVGVRESVRLISEAGIQNIRSKAASLGDFAISIFDTHFGDELVLASPRQSSQRGGHISFGHPQAFQLTRALAERGVVTDFRQPGLIRLGFSPLYVNHQEVTLALQTLRSVLDTRDYQNLDGPDSERVT